MRKKEEENREGEKNGGREGYILRERKIFRKREREI